MDTKQLFSQRLKQFWGHVFPYLRYVVSGGLLAFLVVGAAIGSHFYSGWLETPPDPFPAGLIGMLLLIGPLYVSRIRSYLREPDMIFWHPFTDRMKQYLNKAMIWSLVLQLVPLAIVWLLYWPIYMRTYADELASSSVGSFWIFTVVLLLAKLWNIYSYRNEQQFVSPGIRRFSRVIRFMLMLIWLYVIFERPGLAVMLLFVAVMVLYSVLTSRVPRYDFHWQQWLSAEQKERGRVYRFINWFTDVEELPRQIKAGRGWNFFIKRIPFTQQATYTFLYVTTWLRTDLSTIVVRLALIGLLFVWALSLSWAKAIAFLFFLYICGLQLSSLLHMHRHAVWLHIYPLPAAGRVESVTRFTFRVHVLVYILLSIVMLVSGGADSWGFAAMAVALFFIWRFHYRTLRNTSNEDNQE